MTDQQIQFNDLPHREWYDIKDYTEGITATYARVSFNNSKHPFADEFHKEFLKWVAFECNLNNMFFSCITEAQIIREEILEKYNEALALEKAFILTNAWTEKVSNEKKLAKKKGSRFMSDIELLLLGPPPPNDWSNIQQEIEDYLNRQKNEEEDN